MASIFKVMKLDHALASQDELDKQNLFLMGLTNTGKTANHLEQNLAGLQNNTLNELGVKSPNEKALSPMNATPQSEIQTEFISNANGSKKATPINSAYTTGKFIKKLRASTKIPIEHKFAENETGAEGNKARPYKVLSLDSNC